MFCKAQRHCTPVLHRAGRYVAFLHHLEKGNGAVLVGHIAGHLQDVTAQCTIRDISSNMYKARTCTALSLVTNDMAKHPAMGRISLQRSTKKICRKHTPTTFNCNQVLPQAVHQGDVDRFVWVLNDLQVLWLLKHFFDILAAAVDCFAFPTACPTLASWKAAAHRRAAVNAGNSDGLTRRRTPAKKEPQRDK